MEQVIYLVTGAAGFLGSHVCDQLLARGNRVRALVLPGDRAAQYIPEAVEIVEGNLCDMPSLENFFTLPKGSSFNLCDVRDLACGCVAAADKGRIGECYILANKEVTLKEMCRMLHDASGCRMPKFYVPISMACKLAALMEKKAKKTGEKPLMTNFAVYNLARNNQFDSSKAERELGYHTRSYEETLRDEARWLMKEGYIQQSRPLARTVRHPAYGAAKQHAELM